MSFGPFGLVLNAESKDTARYWLLYLCKKTEQIDVGFNLSDCPSFFVKSYSPGVVYNVHEWVPRFVRLSRIHLFLEKMLQKIIQMKQLMIVFFSSKMNILIVNSFIECSDNK